MTKMTALTENSSPATEDLIVTTDDPSGTPASRKVTISNLLAIIDALTQTLTNKTIDGDNNTISNLAHGSEVDNPTSGVHGATGTIVGTTDTQTLTNKTIDGNNNTITNVASSSASIIKSMPPATSAATIDFRAGGSSPVEQVSVWDFADDADEYMDYLIRLEGYNGGGLTVTLEWTSTSATTNNVVWGAAFRRLQDDAEDIDSAHTYQFNEVTDTAPSASGEVLYPQITFTDGADMDSLADGELAILRIRRNGDDASDNMAGDAELLSVRIEES